MRWNILFDPEIKFVRAFQSGEFSLPDQARFLKDIFESQHWLYGVPLMIDYCHLDVSGMHFHQITSLSQLMMSYKEKIGPGKIAILCDDEVQFGVGRQFQMMVEIHLDREIHVYRDEAAAIHWLNA